MDFRLVKWPDGRAERFDHARTGWRLEKSHAALTCEKCHTAASRKSPAAALAPNGTSHWTGLETACASCHEDAHRGALGSQCASCHDTGKWKVTPGFAHDTTDYPLTGRHATVTCNKCHLAARLSPRRDAAGHPVPVYRPVPHNSCAACHADPHNGQFGAECATCHATTRPFKQIARGGFNHSATRFPLRGRHAATACSACHRGFATEQDKRPAFGTCTACHADAHGGNATLTGRPVDCASCHDERGFSPSTFPLERHQKTRFPLLGKHEAVKCSACHRKDKSGVGAVKWGTSRVIVRPAFATCAGCHADQHGAQLAGRAGGSECASCHEPSGWAPSRFDVGAHAKLRLPLDGRHGEIACRDCHGADRKGLPPLDRAGALGPAGFAFKGVDPTCTACHLDPHAGRFGPKGAEPAKDGCLSCHDTRAFRPTTVGMTAHEAFAFPLTGAHRATPCSGCHSESKRLPDSAQSTLVAGGGRLPTLTFEAPTACAQCHRTVHGAQFDGRKDGGRCDACHGTDAFAPASRFDHDKDASFALKGGHRDVPCASCHRPDPAATGPGRLLYRPLSGKCETCHTKKS